MTSSSIASSATPRSAPEVSIRPLRPEDREPLQRILIDTAAFSDDEVAVALELIDEGDDGTPDAYHFAVAEHAGQVVGYVCWGHTPCTVATFDLYWIAVDPSTQGLGVGRRLVERCEQAVREQDGHLVLIETAGKPGYDATRAFYLRTGYLEEARLRNFYAPGDDKVIYAKTL
ncbi:MAG: GNAT family N-acetyltransferase [Pseudomonadota bacterium]